MKPRDHLTPFHDINVNNPLQIREQIAARIEVCEQIVDAAKKGEREISEIEQKEFDAVMDEVGSHSKRTGLHGQLQLAEEKERCSMAIATQEMNKQRKPFGTGSEFLDIATGLPVRALSSSQRVSSADDISPGRVVASMLLNEPGILNRNEREILAQQSGGSDTGGGYLLPSPVSERFVDLARSASVCLRAGAQAGVSGSGGTTGAAVTARATRGGRQGGRQAGGQLGLHARRRRPRRRGSGLQKHVAS